MTRFRPLEWERCKSCEAITSSCLVAYGKMIERLYQIVKEVPLKSCYNSRQITEHI